MPLTLYYVNATSIQHLHSDLVAHKVKIGDSTTTPILTLWTPQHLDNDLVIDGHALFRRDRVRRKGGVVCAYVNAKLKCELCNHCPNADVIEIMWLKISTPTMLYVLWVDTIHRNPNMMHLSFCMS